MCYDISEHKHNFAVWAAARAAHAAREKSKGATVEKVKDLIEHIKLNKIHKPHDLPQDFDKAHKKWCDQIVAKSGLTHGVAAKIINVYLKSIFVCGGYEQHDKVKNIHPPIDSMLLEGLAKKFENPVYKKVAWTTLSYEGYKKIISAIKKDFPNEPLWMAEEYWPVHKNSS